jgi:opacity protein-like surface antigen
MVALFALVSSPARAQDAPSQPAQESNSSGVEITPYVALGSIRASDVGIGVSFPVTSRASIETETGCRRGEGHINAFSSHVSLLYALPQLGRSTPYVAAGAGLEQYGTALAGPQGIVTLPRTAFAVNAGAGLKVPIDDNMAMRIDARWFKSFGRQGSSEHWRVAHGLSFGRKR